MNKYKKLFDNSIILTLGNFGSKIINFLLVPLYTTVLSTSQYGFVDIINTALSLLVPILTLELGQAIIRFSIGSKNSKYRKMIYDNMIAYILLISLLIILSYPLLDYFNIFEGFNIHFIILLISNIVNNFLAAYARGTNRIKIFSINGILLTLITVLSNIVLLVFFDYGIDGYIISMILGIVISNLYLYIALNEKKRVKKIQFNSFLMNDMIGFSLPIVPNSIMWWVINGSSKLFILHFLGASANGLYAIATKIPTIISLFQTIFSQAWQLSAFEEFESEDRDDYYSQIFGIYATMLFLLSSFLLIIVKPLVSLLVSGNYYESWRIIPFLLLGVLFHSFSSFFGMLYNAAKQTKNAFITSMYGGIVSIVMNIILIPTYGTVGASIANAVSFFVLFIVRYWDTRHIAKVNINGRIFSVSLIIYVTQTILLLKIQSDSIYLIQIILFTLLMIINRKLLWKLITVFYSIFNNMRNRK